MLRCACAKFKSADVWIVMYEFATTAAVHTTPPLDQLSQIWRVLSGNRGEYVVQIWSFSLFSTLTQNPIVVELRRFGCVCVHG